MGRARLRGTEHAASSFVALLLWLYYSAQIFLLGAEFTAQLSVPHDWSRARACDDWIESDRAMPLIARIPLLARWSSTLAAVAACVAVSAPLRADSLDGPALVSALRQGGYVIVMRHPSSPSSLPDKAQADPRNTKLERQLDEVGRKTAQEMGEAFRKLHIPVGEVLSSPTFRATEAVRLAQLGKPKTLAQLDDGGQSMQSNADNERSTWLRKKVTESPRAGTNTVIVTHTPNLTGAFGKDAADVAAGEALLFRPNGPKADLVARIKIEEWPRLAGSP